MTNVSYAGSPAAPAADAGARARVLPAAPAERLRILLGVFLALVWGVNFLLAGTALLNDPDTLWHIAVGADIWRSGDFPQADAYSHSHHGDPWIAKEWLSQIALYGAHALGGWNGVVLLTSAALIAALLQLYWALSGELKPIAAAGLAALAMSLCTPVFLARPHILALPVVLVFIIRVWGAAYEKRAPSFWLLGVLCLWANLHASFTFGFAAAAAAFALYLERSRDFRSRRALRWIVFLALLPVASVIHPYGAQSILSTLSVANSEALPYVNEWRAFALEEDMGLALALLALLAFALASRFRTNIATALFICSLIILYFSHARFMYLLALLAPMLLARDLGAQFTALSFQNWARGLGGANFETALARRAEIGAGLLAAIGAAALGVFLAMAEPAPPGKTYPQAAIQAARGAGLSGNVLNDYNFGGALIFEGAPTFVDGRADRLFQNGFLPEIARTKRADGEETLRRQLDRYDIAWTLLPPGDARLVHLDRMPEWSRAYEDEFAVIHMRKDSED